MSKIKGLHHVTAIATSAKRNLDFYTQVLGLRLVKKTVNFDDPETYHLYFGNEGGEPGTILTFFPWDDVDPGRRGASQATEVAFRVPKGSLEWWLQRLDERQVIYNKPAHRFDERYLVFLDPDGLKLELVEVDEERAAPFAGSEVPGEYAIRGFFGVTLTVNDAADSATLLTGVFGYEKIAQHVNRHRYASTDAVVGNIIDLVELPHEEEGVIAGGSVHHVAFRTESVESQAAIRQQLRDLGYQPTPQIDRDYFMAIYFREPQGILFEIATDPPGFTVDEPIEELGTHLKLPEQYEDDREEIEKSLQVL